jgi:hypothetical protein
MGRRMLTNYPSMKRIILWKLEFSLMNRVLYIDWNMAQLGNRWRLMLGKSPMWFPLGDPPKRRGKYWAWYPKGQERDGWTL